MYMVTNYAPYYMVTNYSPQSRGQLFGLRERGIGELETVQLVSILAWMIRIDSINQQTTCSAGIFKSWRVGTWKWGACLSDHYVFASDTLYFLRSYHVDRPVVCEEHSNKQYCIVLRDSKEGSSPTCFSLPCTTLHCFVDSTFR